ncbi:MAG TPA: CBS domain-containing protein [Gammaproteobacteria bacterium]|jgi:CBS domain-containing protein
MTVGNLCNHNVATVGSDATVAEAARRMREAHVGDLVVTEQRNGLTVPIGMITDRDLVIEVLAAGVEPGALAIRDLMSRDIVTVHEDNGLEFALSEMRRRGLRRVPVVDAKNALIGILSVDDVIDHLARLLGHVADAYRIERHTEQKMRP